jgi:two-component system sensor histidine kinase KdpD
MQPVDPEPSSIPAWIHWLGWTAALALVTVGMLSAHQRLDQVHVVLVYLLVVLGGSATSGRPLGVLLACAGFVLIDYFFQPPFSSIGVGKPLDWMALIAYLITAVVSTQLLARARAQAARARERSIEVASLAERLVAQAEHAAALREADRARNELLASVSHDLRTPLTTIKALAQSAAMRGNEAAASIEEQADRLTRMVSDLLDLSRLRAGAFPLAPEIETADDLVGAAVRQTSGIAAEHPVRAAVDLREPALVGQFDFTHSLRILVNFIENAARHSPVNSEIELGVRREGGMLRFSVSDRGSGIPSQERERIFESFYRSPGANPDAGHAGLGLSIAKRLAEAQGGSVEYAPRVGGGSTFSLLLPAVDLTPPPDADAEADEESGSL